MLLSGWSFAPVVSATGSALPKAPTLAPRAMPLSVVAPSAVTLVGSARAARGRCVARRAVQRPRAARIVCAGSGADDYAGMLSRALRTIDTGALGSVPAAAAYFLASASKAPTLLFGLQSSVMDRDPGRRSFT